MLHITCKMLRVSVYDKELLYCTFKYLWRGNVQCCTVTMWK